MRNTTKKNTHTHRYKYILTQRREDDGKTNWIQEESGFVQEGQHCLNKPVSVKKNKSNTSLCYGKSLQIRRQKEIR